MPFFLKKMSEGRQFKKGQRPHNSLPVGSERGRNGFLQVKVSERPTLWRPKHLLIWEKKFGPLPDDQELRFIDGDRSHVSLENLEARPLDEFERVDENGFWRIKIPKTNRWRLKHVQVWEAAHGPIPKGHTLYFADGNRDNPRLDNLVLTPVRNKWSLSDLRRVALQMGVKPRPGLESLNLESLYASLSRPGRLDGMKRRLKAAVGGGGLKARNQALLQNQAFLGDLASASSPESASPLADRSQAAPASEEEEIVGKDGHIYVRGDGIKLRYPSSRWRKKAHVIWEAAHGPIPPKNNIIFIDGDKTNLALENLVLKKPGIKRSKPVNSERTTYNGLLAVKVAEPNVWKLKHHVVWEAAHGPIPPKHNVVFIDGDKKNLALENLALVLGSKSKFVGTEILYKSNGSFMVKVKVAEPGVWKWKHHVIWEAAHGPIPPNHKIIFMDGDMTNCVLGNLAMVSADEFSFLHGKKISAKILKNKELYQSALQVAKVNKVIREKRQALSDIAAGEK